MEFTIHLAAIASIFLVVAALLRITILRSGTLLASGAFPFALGSYVLAICFQVDDRLIGPALVLAPIMGATFGGLISFIAIRMSPPTVFTATLLFQGLAYFVVYNWYEPNSPIGSLSNLTNGAQGISLFDAEFFGLQITSNVVALLFVPLCILVWRWCLRFEESAAALGLDAHRIDPVMANGLGVEGDAIVIRTLVVVHALLAFLGTLYGAIVGYVDPTLMSVQSALFLFALGLMGVFGKFFGPVLGVLLMVVFPEVLRIFLTSEETASAVKHGLAAASILAALLLQGVSSGSKLSATQNEIV